MNSVSERRVDITAIPESDWDIARFRYSIIRPLIENDYRTRKDVEVAASAADVNASTVYKWISAWLGSRQLSALVPARRGVRPGTLKLSQEADDVITSVLDSHYLKKSQLRASAVIEEIESRCRTLGISAPHPNTVRNRLRDLPPDIVTLRRRGRSAARDKFSPLKGAFPGADYPLSLIQLDHSKADIIVLGEDRKTILGRPWITLAIDVATRMVASVYVSMDRPNAATTGICLSRGMLSKSQYLSEIDVTGNWPVEGKFRAIHLDNAAEFRGAVLARACEEHAIDIHFRPVKLPHYGGHIERLMGTVANELRRLPGATFSSPSERGEYKSEKSAALTFSEFETYLVDFIVNVYHMRRHEGIGTSPLARWKKMTQPEFGASQVPAPVEGIISPERLKVDFLPFIERTVQRYGVAFEGIHYYDEVLATRINAPDSKNPNKKQKFLFRYNPENLSTLKYFDPDLEQYFDIPYRNLERPPSSLRELQAARKTLLSEGRREIDEDSLFDAIDRLRQRREDAVFKKRSVRQSEGAGRGRTESMPELNATNEPNLRNASLNAVLDDDLFAESPVLISDVET